VECANAVRPATSRVFGNRNRVSAPHPTLPVITTDQLHGVLTSYRRRNAESPKQEDATSSVVATEAWSPNSPPRAIVFERLSEKPSAPGW
jgi:hypothetical protein